MAAWRHGTKEGLLSTYRRDRERKRDSGSVKAVPTLSAYGAAKAALRSLVP